MNGKTLFVVGIGPGSYEDMTIRAVKVLSESELIVGYTRYCDLCEPYFPNKEYIRTPMTTEEERVGLALKNAAEGRKTALISGGDPGVYGMAGLALNLVKDYPGVGVKVIPGVTAALSGAALLGAPLVQDFCVISLSDRLTPREVIERRLTAAAEAALSVVLYNPESRGREGYLRWACDIFLKYREEAVVCGFVRNIGREGEECRVLSLKELRETKADMFTTVFIGNPSTKLVGEKMVSERGYESEG